MNSQCVCGCSIWPWMNWWKFIYIRDLFGLFSTHRLLELTNAALAECTIMQSSCFVTLHSNGMDVTHFMACWTDHETDSIVLRNKEYSLLNIKCMTFIILITDFIHSEQNICRNYKYMCDDIGRLDAKQQINNNKRKFFPHFVRISKP